MLLLITTAFAADNELGIGVSGLPHQSGPGDALGFYDQTPMTELFGGVRVHDNVAIVGAVAHNSVSQMIGASDSSFSNAIDTRTWVTAVKVGARFSLDLAPWYAPYATVQAVGLHTLLRLDDDPSVDDNLTQVEASGFTGGAQGTVGSIFRIRLTGKVRLGLSGEVGYAWLAPDQIGDVATVKLDGVTGRLGASVCF